ncbi:META domain-containing protein [Flavobacterium sp.]|uniref:META domain-containing protein n=1 Tax=Flavobacterium sp. TaxID=239 RepID=UPI0026253066|nr:META domain-containing protein [Flavobacterium sp.]
MKNLSIIILASIFVLSCSCKKNVSEADNQNINRVWMLVSFKNYTKEDLVKKNAFLNLNNSKRALAKMGCNNLSFGYKISENTITFSQGISTKMYCQGFNLEIDFCNEITSILTYKIEGHKLTLTSSKGEKMEFVAQDWD